MIWLRNVITSLEEALILPGKPAGFRAFASLSSGMRTARWWFALGGGKGGRSDANRLRV